MHHLERVIVSIHVEDLFGALHVVGRRGDEGAYNFTAPVPVRNRELAVELGRTLGRPALVPTPAFAVRLALGELGNVVLEGQRVLPRRLHAEGYAFRFPTLREALADLAPQLWAPPPEFALDSAGANSYTVRSICGDRSGVER